jgi:hypothetical protein
VADLDASLMHETLDIPQRQRETDVEHHRQSDDLGAALEVPEGVALGHLARLGDSPILLKDVAMATPFQALCPLSKTTNKECISPQARQPPRNFIS